VLAARAKTAARAEFQDRAFQPDGRPSKGAIIAAASLAGIVLLVIVRRVAARRAHR
jgi:hypothetical protein